MKRSLGVFLVGVVSVVLFSGCVPITYTKSVTVRKDASGSITEIIEYEGITEPHTQRKRIKPIEESMPFQHLK